MKISFQGELGSYSHQACSEAFPNAVPLPCSTFEMAMDQVKEENAQYTIIPVENSTYGRVADAYYLLPNSGLFIIENEHMDKGGIVVWEDDYWLRHLTTNKYLKVSNL